MILLGRGSVGEVRFGPDLTEVRFPLTALRSSPYGRVVVMDAAGKRAWSNPFWLDA